MKNHILSVYIIGMNTKKSIVFLEQLARSLDEFEIPLCLMVGEKDDELEAQLKTLGCVAVWCSSFEDCREQMQTGKVKVVFIMENNKAVGLSLVKWMKKEGAEHLVVILGENRDKETEELIEEYPIMLFGSRNRAEMVTSYVRGLHSAGMVLWTKCDWLSRIIRDVDSAE